MSYSFPSGYNTFVPDLNASGNLIVNFSRSLKSYAVNQYITLTPVKKTRGLYNKLGIVNQMRLLGGDGSGNAWPDGQDAPFGEYNQAQFEMSDFFTKRKTFQNFLGYEAAEQADWDIKAQFLRELANQAMTLRTNLVDTALTTSGNYDSTHVATATALGGGFWSAGSIASPYIQKTMMAAASTIMLDTQSAVEYTNLSLLINPVTADTMARSAEIRDFIAQSPVAMDQVRGNVPNQNAEWGLPERLYGMKIIVEKTAIVTTPFGATPNTAYTMPNNYAVILAKSSKDLVDNDMQTNFSTAHIFSYEEMNTETFDDTINRRHIMRVTENYDVKLVAPQAGFLITNLFS